MLALDGLEQGHDLGSRPHVVDPLRATSFHKIVHETARALALQLRMREHVAAVHVRQAKIEDDEIGRLDGCRLVSERDDRRLILLFNPNE